MIQTVTFLVTKYYAFFFILAFIGDRFQNSVLSNSHGYSELLQYTLSYFISISWAVLLLVLVLGLPFYFVLRVRNGSILLLCLTILLLVEYGLYTWGASPSDLWNGVYNAIITVVFLFLFFKPVLVNAVNR